MKVGEHPNMIIAVIDPEDNYGYMVNPNNDLRGWLDSYCLADSFKCPNFPQEIGVYVCTIERHFTQGYSEGYPAPGESDYWLELQNIRKVDLLPYMEAQP